MRKTPNISTKHSGTETVMKTKVDRQDLSANWQSENREAIESYNKRIQANGTFSDGLRSF